MSTEQLTAQQLADIYGCSARSVSNYVKADAPLNEPAKMFAWFAVRKNTPRRTLAKGLQAVVDDYAAAVDGSSGSERKDKPERKSARKAARAPRETTTGLAGAQHALRRLERMEVELGEAAEAGGGPDATDPLLARAVMERYLKVSEVLLRYDAQVSAERRDSGESIARADAERTLTNAIVWTRRGVEDYLNSVCLQIVDAPNPETVYALIATRLRECLGTAVAAALKDGKFPAWAAAALAAGL